MSSGHELPYKGDIFKIVGCKNAMEKNTQSMFPDPNDNIGIWVDYFRIVYDKGTRIEQRFGFDSIVRYDNGYIGIECADRFQTVKEAKDFINVKRSVVNNWYCGFGIRKTEYDKSTGTYTHEVIMPCEATNSVTVTHIREKT